MTCLAALSWALTASATTEAQDIVEAYLTIPCSPEVSSTTGRAERLATLRPLLTMHAAAVAAIADALPRTTCATQRRELVELLGRFPSAASAEVVLHYLHDSDPQTRGYAIHSLRLHASRIRRAGIEDVPEEPSFPPAVDGLVPHLIAASVDDDERNRCRALWALADTRDPTALAAIRERLRDRSVRVRFTAACLLTEVHDESGLDELGAGLEMLSSAAEDAPLRYPSDARHLLIALERVTGQSMGPVPADPMLSSAHPDGDPERHRRIRELLEAWHAWWDERYGHQE